MKKFLSILLVAVLVSAMFAIPVSALHWAEGEYDVDEKGNYHPHNAYGFVFDIKDVNATTASEGNIIITSEEAYLKVTNASWVAHALLAPTEEENVYTVVKEIDFPGKAAADVIAEGLIDFNDGKILLYSHSSASKPVYADDGETYLYPNWEQKVAVWALANTIGAKITLKGIDVANGTCEEGATATVEDKPATDEPVVDPDEPVIPDEPVVEDSYNLVAESTPWAVTGDGKFHYDGDVLVMHANSTWPCIQGYYTEAISVNVENTYLVYDIVVEGQANINFIFANGGTFSFSNSTLGLKEGEYDAGSGDLNPGTYTGKIALSDLVNATANLYGAAFPAAEIVDGVLTFAGINVFSVGNDVDVIVNKLALVTESGDIDEPADPIDPPADPELSVEEEMKEALGTEFDDAKLDLVIGAPEAYKAGDDITVTVTVENITAENGIHVLEFALYYDNEKLLLTNDLDEEDNNALICIETLPKGWENLSNVANDWTDETEEGETVNPLNDGKISVIVLTDKTAKSAAVKDDGVLVFTFTFKALEDSEGEIGLVIPHAEAEGAYNTEMGADTYKAKGDYAVIHQAITLDGYAPTCTDEGLSDGLQCAVCGKILVEQTVLAPLGHTEGEWVTTVEPGIGTAGWAELRCSLCGKLLDEKELEALCILGDINNNGSIEKFDYIAVKRAVMGTLTLDGIQQKAADVNLSGSVEKYDYVLVKRHVMGTYVISVPQTAPEFTNRYLSVGNSGLIMDRITDEDAIILTGVNVNPSYGAVIVYTNDYGQSTPAGLANFVVSAFEYNCTSYGYVMTADYGKGNNKVTIPDDGFVLAIHESQSKYISRFNAIPDGETVFPHGVHAYNGNDFSINRTDVAPVIDGVIGTDEYGVAIDTINPDNVGWSYEQFQDGDVSIDANYYSTYDDDYLYLAVEVKTPFHYCPLNQSDAGSMWNYCSVLVNISSQAPDSEYIAKHFDHIVDTTATADNVVSQYGFAVSDSGESLFASFLGAKNTNISSTVVRNDAEETTVYEIAIPLADYGISAESGSEFGLSFAMYLSSSSWTWQNIFARNGGGIINRNDWSKMIKVTLE